MSEAYQRIGQPVAFGDVQIDLAAVEPVRHLVAADIVTHPTSRVQLIETEQGLASRMWFSFSARPDDLFETNGQTRYVTVKQQDNVIPDAWQLTVSLFTHRELNQYANKRVLYRFESFAGELLTAKKLAYLVLGDSYIESNNGQIREVVATERKMYERPLIDRDCRAVAGLLTRTLRRSGVCN